MAIPSLNPEEFQYMDSGVLLNADAAMPFVDIETIDGLDAASIRLSTATRENANGGWATALYEDPRTVTLEGSIYAPTDALEVYLDSLKANYAPQATPQPLYFGTDIPETRMVLGKSLGLRYAKSQDRRLGIIKFQVQVHCEDPRIYTPAQVFLNAPGTLTLSGNRKTTGTITINGDRTNPTITYGDTTFAFPAYSIASGHAVVIDLDQRTVILDGTDNVRGEMTIEGPWPELGPGDNTFTVGGSGTGTIQIAARSAWR